MKQQLILKSPIPNFLDKESNNFDSTKVQKHGMLYFYDKKFAFILADFILHQHELKESIKWQVWVKIDIDIIINIGDYLDDPETIIPGVLYSPIYFFENSKGLKVDVVFESGNVKVPKIRPKLTSGELYQDYTNGVEKFRFQRWSSFLNS